MAILSYDPKSQGRCQNSPVKTGDDSQTVTYLQQLSWGNLQLSLTIQLPLVIKFSGKSVTTSVEC